MKSKPLDAAIAGMREGGMPYRAIGEVLGISTIRAWQIANREQVSKEQNQRYEKRMQGIPRRPYTKKPGSKWIRLSYR